MNSNIDQNVVNDFGSEWGRFDQTDLTYDELLDMFNAYFSIFPWNSLKKNAVGFDLGCGSGRWAKLVAPKVGQLHCIDPSSEALNVAKQNLDGEKNCIFHQAGVDQIPLEDESVDFGYSLGVLHHIPDTTAGIKSCVRKLKPVAPFLVYLYYRFDNRPGWFRLLWQVSNLGRNVISRLPYRIKHFVTDVIALLIYLPLSRFSRLLELLGVNIEAAPLSYYRNRGFYVLRTDALDRFGTKLEKRYTKAEIVKMMENAGLERITFSDKAPYWCAVGYKGQ
jgi:ubiquinone/menaquinone biosynthesis C-methylase UbiE